MIEISVGEGVTIAMLAVIIFGGGMFVGRLDQRVKIVEKIVFNELGHLHKIKKDK